MRAHEIIRSVLDLIDQIETSATDDEAQSDETAAGFYDDQTRRMNQIKDLVPSEGEITGFANAPGEAYASIEAVTTDAGGGWMAPKHPADIRADSIAMYPKAQPKI